MKPGKVFLFFLSILTILGFLALFVPSEIVVAESITLRFPSWSSFFKEDTTVYADVSSIVRTFEITPDTVPQKQDTLRNIPAETVVPAPEITVSDSIRNTVRPIEFPADRVEARQLDQHFSGSRVLWS